ncbi:leucine-rich repeat domain-containing protein [Rhizobium laguerreae]|uniref:leucine-rich repeat domain-containing protein n=1 Tax=Rhizobium laguerreae TaxID=1076926 RepID=UPI001C926CD2|nr:hypothetical protein [Rhizobium laguerreae]MBY3483957.1 leucine-rich repeat domain-containing protein [Rhizobium laguerreae]MBY3533552.1 leucine-rich repeat domain-containing protein [Rhizobium laguerreae]
MSHWLDVVVNILNSKSSDLRVLAEIAGYDPKILYKGTVMAGVDLSNQDIDDLDLDIPASSEEVFSPKKAKQFIIDNVSLPLEWKENIFHFRASNRIIYNINQLGGSRNLREVKINNTYVESISSLSSCFNLRTLQIKNTAVSDLAPIVACGKLVEVNISGTKITDLSPLRGKNITSLEISQTTVDEISELNLRQLRKLDVSATRIEDLSCLKDSEYLSNIDISQTKIDDISFLSGKKFLRYIRADNTTSNWPENTGPFLSLEGFYASRSAIESIEFLSKSSHMRILIMPWSKIRYISDIEKMPFLFYADLEGTAISDISPIAQWKSIKYLSLSSTKIHDITPLQKLTKLSNLEISNTAVTDLSCISDMESLKDLDISGCAPALLKNLDKFKSLTSLNISRIEIDRPEDIRLPPNLRSIIAPATISKYVKLLCPDINTSTYIG